MPSCNARRLVAILGSLLFVLPFPSRAVAWKDPSPHLVRFIEAEPGVRLEVLDWGGSGDPILLLAGHGDSGHILDDFAPHLTDRFRVLALTRRGFGASSQPKQGYDLSRLVHDIAQVVKALNLGRVYLVGHSIAGDEMTRFALTYPEKTRKLVYLEAAYDRVDAQQLELKFPKLPPYPPTSEDLRSPQALCNFVARTEIPMPESEIRATRVFGPDGRFVRPVTPDWILRAVAKIVEHPDYAAIHKPLLAIYAVYDTPAQFAPRYGFADHETQEDLGEIFDMWRQFTATQRQLLRNGIPSARVVEIHGANHYIFISHQEKVLEEMRVFLQAP